MGVVIEDDDNLFKKLQKDIAIIGKYGVDIAPAVDGRSTPLKSKNGGDIRTYAAANEFGARIPHKNGKVTVIPERSFLRSTFDDDSVINKVTMRFARLFGMMIDGRSNAVDVMNGTGDAMIAEIQSKISSNVQPANAASTIKRKGSGKGTLFDTGSLLKSISRKVFKK